ncbi:MAG: 6-phosphofructokinase [Clostridiales bacterium]|jgi:6-phosphofructokinase 1|nr:6-phosphofructokinase [Clostridiales bacterium]
MGKNVIVAQSGGPTAVINASLAGVVRSAKEHGLGKVYGAIHGVEGVMSADFIDLTAEFNSEEKLNLLAHTPAAYLGTCRHKLPAEGDEVLAEIFKIFEKHDIGFFFYIGGNDSMDTVDKLAKYAQKIGSDVKIVGVPKTIDNDLAITDHTPGFGSAAKYVATSMREIILDSKVYDINTLTIVEIMGRNAGWLTASAALARTGKDIAPHMIYLPEVAFDVDKFLADLEKAIEKHRNVVVAISEGLKTADGRYLCWFNANEMPTDAFGHIQLTGAAISLAEIVKKRIKVKVRAIELSLLQRSAGHIASEVDAREAEKIGEAAVTAAMAGKSGIMMYFKRLSGRKYEAEICDHDVSGIANTEKKVPREWINPAGNDVKQELVDYIKPLIEGESMPDFEGGLPLYISR